ncbi:MAG TPA: hypothetical protein VH063_01080 [Gaiellaceae bacterium]|jgi:hypothetical protein|nr:hypothetical protein [Gaiellaceae bacterium]
MAERKIEEIYTGLRDQALSFGSVEIKASPVVPGGQALGVMMDMGYDTAVVSILGLADGTTSMYISNGGGMIGMGENPNAAAASKRWVEVAEAALPALTEGGDDRLPEEGTIGFNVLTTGPRFAGEAAESELQGGSHPLSALYAAGQEVLTQIRIVDETQKANA